MANDEKTKPRLEIAHVLFIDIVEYSKLLTNEQSEALQELNQIVRNTAAVREAEAAGHLIILPTGDGMALVFTGSVERPAECALEVSQALKESSEAALLQPPYNGMGQPNTPIRETVIGFPLQRRQPIGAALAYRRTQRLVRLVCGGADEQQWPSAEERGRSYRIPLVSVRLDFGNQGKAIGAERCTGPTD